MCIECLSVVAICPFCKESNPDYTPSAPVAALDLSTLDSWARMMLPYPQVWEETDNALMNAWNRAHEALAEIV